jgi:hypothetical protein
MSGFYIVDSVPRLASDSFPYEARFRRADSHPVGISFSAMVFIPVATLYAHPYNNARVVLNGHDIGGIFAHPWTDHSIINFDIETFAFSADLLDEPFNRLQIVPERGDTVLVGNVWAHTT